MTDQAKLPPTATENVVYFFLGLLSAVTVPVYALLLVILFRAPEIGVWLIGLAILPSLATSAILIGLERFVFGRAAPKESSRRLPWAAFLGGAATFLVLLGVRWA